MDKMIERISLAISESAQIGHSIRLVRLVDGVSTYEMTFDGHEGKALEFPSYSDASEHLTAYKRKIQARAVLDALGHDDLVAALASADAFFRKICEATDLDEDDTALNIDAVSPDGSRRELTKFTLRQMFEKMNSALAKARGQS